MSHLNKMQIALLRTIAQGDYAYIAEGMAHDADAARQAVLSTGDTLLRFLFTELSTNEDCDGVDEAISRLENVERDIRDLIAAMTTIESNPTDGADNPVLSTF